MYNILVCDDEKDIVSALKIYLMADGYQVFEAYNGREALEILKNEDIHLVLMDITLPFYNGYHWCSEIRKFSRVPIIFISSAADNMNIIMAMNLGADDFVAKPFDLKCFTCKNTGTSSQKL